MSVKIPTSLDLAISFVKSTSIYTAKHYSEWATLAYSKVASRIQIPPATSKWHLAAELTGTSPATSTSEQSISKLRSGLVFTRTLFPPGEAPSASPTSSTNL